MNTRSSLQGAALTLTVALALLLGGCGPNGGGTGTGDAVVPLSDFGARAASTCSAPFAAALDCSAGISGATDGSGLPGSGAVVFAGSAASGPYLLRVQGNRATFEARCGGARFEGSFGLLPDGQTRFLGLWQPGDGSGAVHAQLWVLAAPAGLQVSVLDAEGRRTLFGPLPMQRLGAEPTAAPTCP